MPLWYTPRGREDSNHSEVESARKRCVDLEMITLENLITTAAVVFSSGWTCGAGAARCSA